MMKHITVILFILFFMANGALADMRIITNKSVGVKSMSPNDIKDIFLGKKKKWPDNTKIYFVISSNENFHNTFLETYIHKSPKQYETYWKTMLFTGKGAPPKQFKTTKALIEYVADTQGAIGYIDSDSPPSNVNTISIE